MSFYYFTFVCLALIFGLPSCRPSIGNVCPYSTRVSYMHQVYKTKMVPYQYQSYFGGYSTRYRQSGGYEPQVSYRYETRYTCCPGYEGSIYSCRPVCQVRCPANSFCAAPQQCRCNEGYGGSECQPLCPAVCGKHEFCERPGQCSCLNGYSRNSRTENCQPVCPEGCGDHGFCAEPSQCQCEPGYEKIQGACQPSCDPECGPNSYCKEPHLCACLQGYQEDAQGHCSPFCGEGCGQNSRCVRPGVCECEPGYAGSESGTNCRPECSSCPENSSCSAPEVCVCNPGFMKNGNLCEPHCDEDCGQNSRCVRPEICECEPGYAGSDKGTNCQPVCSSCPENGSCTAPEVCVCNPGYMKNGNICQPHCEEACSDLGRCVAPNQCECYPGHEETGEDRKCQPKCSKGCPNGFCNTPEKCACNTGFLMGPNETCEPQCIPACVHGKCTQPGTCSCDPGYRFKDNSQHVCEAICELGCKNGECMAPNVCICKEGYQPEDLNHPTSVCHPVCPTACVNGTCTAPGECSCLEGYTKSSATTCKPHCAAGCEFGDCVAPDECQCLPGYENTDQGCQPQATSTSTSQPTTETSEAVDTTSARARDPITTPATKETDATYADLLQPHYSNCSGGCLCWIEFDDEGILSTAKCAKVCADHQDQPCLDLANCRCDLPSGKMICNDVAPEDEDSSSEETHYVCRVPQRIKARSESEVMLAKGSTSTPKWMVIMGSCAGIILGAAMAAVAAKYYRGYRSRHNFETEAIYEN
ncbi:protein draper isoform X2 [Drosophila rhopaloa]|uniref:EGF-like domain-containing protein n=1 Tax=Drosophila rhopaloa TaxID=1041015 RepID=A0ABM5JC41_DRORH|nr:protein draper isoform X2 [Drosophila rhopaloa]